MVGGVDQHRVPGPHTRRAEFGGQGTDVGVQLAPGPPPVTTDHCVAVAVPSRGLDQQFAQVHRAPRDRQSLAHRTRSRTDA